MSAGWVLLLVFGVLLTLNTPVSFAMIAATMATLLYMGESLIEVARIGYFASAKFPLLAVPFFMLAGNLMNSSGISDRIVRFSQALVGWLPGGLAMIAIFAAMIFGAISGAGTAATAAIGAIMLPAMIARRYDPDDATACVATAAALAVVIPPSIPMIIFSSIVNEASVADLFKGGILPGILAGLILMVAAYRTAKKKGYPVETGLAWSRVGRTLIEALWAFGMPLVILGGIFTGWFSATEAAAVAVAYGLFVGLVIYRTLKLRDLPALVADSAIKTAIPMLLVVAASIFGYILATEEIPAKVAAALLGITQSKVGVLLIFNVIFLIAGCLMESISAMIILVPVLLPVARSIGMDPVHFGVMTVFNLSIGMVTPPVGANLFVASSISKRSLHTVSRAAIPYIIAMLVVLALMTAFPGLTLAFK